MHRMLRFVLLSACASFAMSAVLDHAPAQQLHRWVDKDGRVHYSDQPPPPGARQHKELRPGAAAPTATPGEADAAAPPTLQEREAGFRRRQVEQAEQAAADQKAREEAESKRRNCEQSRNQLAALKAGGRFSRYNAQGEREFLDEQQIAEEIRRTEKAVADWCN